MLLKQVLSGGIIAWSDSQKNQPLFATGSYNDDDQQSFKYLQLYSLDLSDQNPVPQSLGKTKIDHQISSLIWNSFGENQLYPYGIIVAGLQDGSICIFDPNCIINYCKDQEQKQIPYEQHEDNIGCLCYEQQLFDTPVYSLQSNPFKPNLIAAGGGCEVLLLNIEQNISEPQIFSPGSPNLHEGFQICSVSWNKKVQHILASASENGLTVVWDLKTNKAIFNFQDSSIPYNRDVSLSWNPEIPTQIAVAYNDLQFSELQIWDLRNPQGPVMQFSQGHQKGITSLDWCINDPSLILTTGNDNKVICWNYKSGQIVSEHYQNETISKINWSPKIPSIFALTEQTSKNIIIQTFKSDQMRSYPPKWLKTPVGARFAPNGRLVVFGQSYGNVVSEFQVNPLQDLIYEQIQPFEQRMLKDLTPSQYCEEKLQSQGLNEVEQELWKYIKAVTEGKESIMNLLGFNIDETIKEAENLTGKTHRQKDVAESKSQSQQKTNQPSFNFAVMSEQDAEGFFDQLSSQQTKKQEVIHPKQVLPNKNTLNYNNEQENIIMESVSKNINWNAGVERIIKRNIYIGNYEGAIDCALKSGRIGEALLLAFSQKNDKPELFENATQAFFTASQDLFIKNVFKNIIEFNNDDISKTYNLDQWQEVAVLSLTQNKGNASFEQVMENFGQRFMNERQDQKNAILCYILAKNFDKAAALMFLQVQKMVDKSQEKKLKILNVVEILEVFRKVTNSSKGEYFEELVIEFSQIALSYNKPKLAYKLLLNCNNHQDVNTLKFNMYHIYYNDLVSLFQIRPQAPFKLEDVGIKQQRGNQQQQRSGLSKPMVQNQPQTNRLQPSQQTTPARPFNPQNQPQQIQDRPPINLNNTPQTIQPQLQKSQPPARPQFNPPQRQFDQVTQQIPQQQFQQQDTSSQQQNNQNLEQPSVQNKIFNPAQVISQQQPQTNQNPPIKSQFAQQQRQGPPPMKQQPPKKLYADPLAEKPQVKDQQQLISDMPPMNNKMMDNNLTPPSNNQLKSGPPMIIKPQPNVSLQNPPPQQISQQQQQQIPQQKQPVDLRNMNQEQQYIMQTFKKLTPVIENIESNSKRRQEMISHLQSLYEKLASNQVVQNTVQNLTNICKELEKGDMNQALLVHSIIAREDWDNNKDWLKTLKRLIMRK